MAQRLGAYLVQQGKLNGDQLSSALTRQVTVGGRLGTNLVELGFLTDLELTLALSQHLRMAPAQPEVFEDIPPEVIQSLPKELAERHAAVPFRKEGRTLHIAMADPSELMALDELTFAAGCPVKSFLAPEAKILLALEKYYGLARPRRYVSIQATSSVVALLQTGKDNYSDALEQTLPTIENFEHGLKLSYDELLHVKHRDEVVAVLLREFYRVVDHALFFAIAEGRAIGLMGCGTGFAMEALLGLEMKIEQSFLLHYAVAERKPAVQLFSPDSMGPELTVNTSAPFGLVTVWMQPGGRRA